MRVTFNERKFQAKDSFKEKFVSKLSKFDKIFDDTADATVTLSLIKDTYIVELTIFYKDIIFRVEEADSDIWTAMDELMENLKKQIRKYKTKIENKLKKANVIEQTFEDLADDEEEPETVYAPEETEFTVARSKVISLKPMFVDEAILQMNLLGHSFFAFRNAETDQINIVYKRKDDKYGIIETE
ncbi:MAG: ribosome-associated translation inhibitor RaiA [Clostridia bacterium]|nr:ribosome-associated translation inhibitor RaiA [Clostridia bacterium]